MERRLETKLLLQRLEEFLPGSNFPSVTRSHCETPHEDLLSASSHALQQWKHWTVAETARRTIFLANVFHFLSSHDPQSGKPSPYYEPLDPPLIMNMPFPCAVTPYGVHERKKTGRSPWNTIEASHHPQIPGRIYQLAVLLSWRTHNAIELGGCDHPAPPAIASSRLQKSHISGNTL